MTNPLTFLNKTFGVYNIKGFYIEPTYWQAGAIVFLLFLLVLTFARLRYLYIHWSVSKPAVSFLFYGFLLALILEGFLILSGRTMLTEILGWKNPPKPISTALDFGRSKLADTLGVYDAIPESNANEPQTYQSMLSEFEKMSLQDKEMLKSFICEP